MHTSTAAGAATEGLASSALPTPGAASRIVLPSPDQLLDTSPCGDLDGYVAGAASGSERPPPSR